MLKKTGYLITLLIILGGIVLGNSDFNTDLMPNLGSKIQQSISAPIDKQLIDYTVEWTITLSHVACVGLTPVADTLLWVSSGGRTGNADPNMILIYDLRTRTLVDSFNQANTTLWGYRDMCYYNGYVYAGAEATLDKIDPATHAVVASYTVTGISGGIIRALTDNDVEDSLWTCNWAVPIYKFPNTGGAVRQVAANTYSVYGLGYDPHGFCWGSTQTTGSELVKYSYPGFSVLETGPVPELGADGLAGGCEMWGNSFLLYLGQCNPNDLVLCLRLYTVNHDVGVLNIVSPTQRIPPGVPVGVEAVFKNFGIGQETFPATALVTQNGDTVFRKDTSLTIDANQQLSVLFGDFIGGTNLVYNAVFYTDLVGDENPENDTMKIEARTSPDAGVLRIISPITRLTPNITVDASAMVMNFGAAQEIVPVNMTIIDTVTNTTIIDKDTSVILFASESLAVLFGQYTSVNGSAYKVVAYTFLHGDDDPANDTAHALATCGLGSAPDSFGYYYESTQEPSDTVTFSWIDPAGGTQLTGWSPNGDDGYVSRTLPFSIKYYSETPNISSINICTNGFLETSTRTPYTDSALPASSITNLIAPFWDDFDLRTQGAVYENIGYTDGGYVAYSWVGVPRFGTSEFETFQVVLYQNNKIRFNYLTMNGTLNSNTIGIQGATGTHGWYLQYVFDGNPANHIIASSNTIQFTCDRLVGINENTRVAAPVVTQLHKVKPNPVLNGIAQISFTLAKKGNVAINIYDATGRNIRSLVNAPYEVGEYTVTWDGKNDRGNQAMAGIYFYTIQTANYQSTRKLVLMR